MLNLPSKIYTNKSRIWEAVIEIAKQVFEDDLYDIGTEDSFFHRRVFADVDLILVLHRIDLSKITVFLDKASTKVKGKVSCRPLTKMMLENKTLIDGKAATMLYKGVRFLNSQAKLSFGDLREIRTPQIADDVWEIERKVIKGELNKDKAIDLLIQLLVICQKK